MGKKETYLSELERKERNAEMRKQRKREAHKCHRCYEYGRWVGTKFTCMLPRCLKEVNHYG